MTPAIALLKQLKIDFLIHQYQHDPDASEFGKEAVEKLSPILDITQQQVFKTLVVSLNGNPKNLAVCVVPVSAHLDLKKAAKMLASKKMELADSHLAQKITGYLVGGISPVGQKKRLPTLIDSSAERFRTIFISGGRRGLEIEISPQDLATVLKAQFSEISC